MDPQGKPEDEPAWVGEQAPLEVEPPGAALAAWASLFGLLPHRFTPAPGSPRISILTCAFGLASWLLLLIGTPLVAYSFVGCFGAVFELLAFVLVVLFVTRVLRETGAAASPQRRIGEIGLVLAMIVVLLAAWGPVGLFGQETKRLAEGKYHLENGAKPTAEMRSTVWWENHSWVGLAGLWLLSGALLPASLRILGVTAAPWLGAAAGVAVLTGPLMLGFCTLLLKAGWGAGG